MPGLFVLLSLAAVGAMMAMSRSSTPSPRAPIPGGSSSIPDPISLAAQGALKAVNSAGPVPFTYGGQNYTAWIEQAPGSSYTIARYTKAASTVPGSSVPGTVHVLPGQSWLFILPVTPNPGVTLDKAAIEKGLREEVASIGTVTSLIWDGNAANLVALMSKEYDVKIGTTISTDSASIVIASATLLPAGAA